MFRVPTDFAAQTEKAVARAEAGTHAEIVVVLAHRSAGYRATAILFSLSLVYLVLLVALFSHFEIGPLALAVELPLLAVIFYHLSARAPSLIRLLTPDKFLRRAVKSSAHAAFHEESVGGTKQRTGVLVYLSILEARVAVVADSGVLASIPIGELEAVRWSETSGNPHALGQMPDVLNGIAALGALCATHLPNTGPYDNEIPNTPVVRPW